MIRRIVWASAIVAVGLVLSACGDDSSKGGSSDGDRRSGSVREDLQGHRLSELATSPAGRCKGVAEVDDADADAGLVSVRAICVGRGKAKTLGFRLIGLRAENGVVTGSGQVRGFTGFRVHGSRSVNASCSFMSDEIACDPGSGTKWWPNPAKFSVILDLSSICRTDLLISTVVPGPRASTVSTSGLLDKPKTCAGAAETSP